MSRVRSGSPVAYLLRAEPSFAKTVSAAQVLAKRHLPLRVAKALVERLLEKQDVTVEIPQVENAKWFETELEELGITAIRNEMIEEANSTHAGIAVGTETRNGDRRPRS
jgi:predicted flavoprotein YhiN